MCIQFDKVQPKTKEQLKQLIDYAFKHNIYDLNFIDTSKITDMSELFEDVKHNFDISSWDVSNVTAMKFMFYFCVNFNCDLSSWDVSNVTDMNHMFCCCNNFKGKGLDHWNLQSLIYSYCMFYGCDENIIPSWYKSNA